MNTTRRLLQKAINIVPRIPYINASATNRTFNLDNFQPHPDLSNIVETINGAAITKRSIEAIDYCQFEKDLYHHKHGFNILLRANDESPMVDLQRPTGTDVDWNVWNFSGALGDNNYHFMNTMKNHGGWRDKNLQRYLRQFYRLENEGEPLPLWIDDGYFRPKSISTYMWYGNNYDLLVKGPRLLYEFDTVNSKSLRVYQKALDVDDESREVNDTLDRLETFFREDLDESEQDHLIRKLGLGETDKQEKTAAHDEEYNKAGDEWLSLIS